jgi:transcriptional regulator CtsR
VAKKRLIGEYTTSAKVQSFEMLSPMLNQLFSEVKELSKKKQDDALNKLKVGMINKILKQIKTLLEDEPTIQFIELLDDETLPTNSDAVLILAQFRAALDHYHEKYFRKESGGFIDKWHMID